jgi:hypothetical protein
VTVSSDRNPRECGGFCRQKPTDNAQLTELRRAGGCELPTNLALNQA